jgi:hypothetical protein
MASKNPIQMDFDLENISKQDYEKTVKFLFEKIYGLVDEVN